MKRYSHPRKGLIADPTAEEEELAHGSVSIAVHKAKVVFTYKPGGLIITPEDYQKCINLATDRAVSVQNLIGSVLE